MGGIVALFCAFVISLKVATGPDSDWVVGIITAAPLLLLAFGLTACAVLSARKR